MWISNSNPFSKVIANACLVLKIRVTSPSAGATIVSPSAIIAIPSPASFSAKTGSGTSDKGIILPETGATSALGLTTAFSLFESDLNKFLIKLNIVFPE